MPLPDPAHPECYKLALGAYLRAGHTQEKAEAKARKHCEKAQSYSTIEESSDDDGDFDKWIEPTSPSGATFKRGGKAEGDGTNK